MITFENVYKTYSGGVEAVKDLSLEIGEKEVIIFLGTSGSGKTTCIKMVNRLEEVTSGRILVEKTDVRDHDPIELRRKIGYAVQYIGLFPHMTVAENIATVPKLLKWDSDQIEARTKEMLEMAGLDAEEFGDRYPNQLSGGQKQRIGVARALAADPEFMLMDEPFGALDPITRFVLQDAFLELQKKLKKTVLFVTHDIFEAIRLGDRIALLDQGKLQQLDTPSNLIDNPANEFVEKFLGSQRFQLSLITKTIEDVIDKNKIKDIQKEKVAQDISGGLSLSYSLLDAIQSFKHSDEEELPIFKDQQYYGIIEKKELMSSIAKYIENWMAS